MVKVTVAEYVPVPYLGSFVRSQLSDPVLPPFAECASAPKVATELAAVVLAGTAPAQPVPGAVTVQVYANASPVLGGVAIEGPPAGEKSDVTSTPMLPVPPVLVVRIL